jgi:hypothetical protein
MTALMRGWRSIFPQWKFMLYSQIQTVAGCQPPASSRAVIRTGAKALDYFVSLRGPFDFAQGRLLKRRSSTVLPVPVVRSKPRGAKAHSLPYF